MLGSPKSRVILSQLYCKEEKKRTVFFPISIFTTVDRDLNNALLMYKESRL